MAKHVNKIYIIIYRLGQQSCVRSGALNEVPESDSNLGISLG